MIRLIQQKDLENSVEKVFVVASEIEEKIGPLYKNLNMSKSHEEKESLKRKIKTTEKDQEKAKKMALTEIVKAYELFCVYFVGKACTQWDKVVQVMHTKDPWVAVNGTTHKGPRAKTWASFLDCIELHKLTIFSCDTAELHWYYMQTVCQEAPTLYGVCLHATYGPSQRPPGLSAHGQGQPHGC